MLITNDLHISVQRRGGTTPASQEALRTYQFYSLRKLLQESSDEHLLVAGDLFDSFECQTRDWVETYTVFADWLSSGRKLTLIAGNHDNSSKGDKVSDFTALATVLSGRFSKLVQVIDINQTKWVEDGVLAIAHHADQGLFEAALEAALALQGLKTLILHCNLNNTFAQRSDHSLDLSDEMTRKFKRAGVSILLAHEHNARVVGNVTVLGCQFPTSILDCLESPEKFAHRLVDGELQKIPTWSHATNHGYTEVDWREVTLDRISQVGFVRITGRASANEASEVINAISELRKKASPTVYVIGNSVKIDGLIEAEQLPESFEAAKRFDVMDFLSQHLNGEEMKVVEELLEKSE